MEFLVQGLQLVYASEYTSVINANTIAAIEELARLKTNDVVLPTSTGREVRIRCVTALDESQRILLGRLGLELPSRLGEPKWDK